MASFPSSGQVDPGLIQRRAGQPVPGYPPWLSPIVDGISTGRRLVQGVQPQAGQTRGMGGPESRYLLDFVKYLCQEPDA
ncbi:uncharacterized protein CCOS01_09249 [Colletotrichum costaricense]|uniref:Uncharacterized protein n=1 Tax=Colletotrichum costaricense TaxID=1209916 RepID=A0AAI9YUE6_9PEZI|nr:uncharacterized protein CCOS01_09249 [Colletotrichum costaricense]KAK1524162.1 hypothetical protein CCOS01_09249 [Colletotrichum costaricense]